jgi:hypothetical protein
MEKLTVLGPADEESALERETAMMGSTVNRREYPRFRQRFNTLER